MTSVSSRFLPSGRRRGLALALLGVLTVTPDALLVRYAGAAGGTAALVLLFKAAFTGAAAAASALIQASCQCSTIADGLRAGPKHLAVVSFFQALIQAGFPLSFLYTSAARALLLVSLNPLWAALLGRFVLKDKLANVTVVTLAISLGSTLVVFLPPLLLENEDRRATAGDVIAFGTGVALAGFLTTSRWAAMRRPGAALSFTPVIANAVLALFCLPFAVVDYTNLAAPLDPIFWLVMAADGICLTVALVCIVNAGRHARSAEVALVLLIENILGPFWVFLGFGEIPSFWTLVGGLVLMITLALHELYFLFRAKSEDAQPHTPTSGSAERSHVTVEVLSSSS
jgi:drug/metabolite transporter (DMT)-like permease